MASFVFVSYAGYPYTPSSLCPDNGLGILAATLRAEGHDVLVLDFGTVQTMRRLYPPELAAKAAPLIMALAQTPGVPPASLVQELAALDARLEAHQASEVEVIASEVTKTLADVGPAFVGFKLWNGDGFTGSVTIAQAVRKRLPEVPILAGGPQATWAGAEIFNRTDAFDAVAVGEGEGLILELAARAVAGRDLAGIPGVATSADTPVAPTTDTVMDELPCACYDESVYPAMSGDQKLKIVVLDDSRGCPYQCAFCMHSYESGSRLRTRSARRIVDDMQDMVTRHGIRAFRFAGSSTPGRLMGEVADEIARRSLTVAYTSFAHFGTSLPEHYAKMKASGLHAMFFGLETGSPELLREACGKRTDPDQVRSAMRAAKQAGIKAVCSMIVPMPFETEETLEESIRLLLDVRPDSVPVQFPGLLPGTRWFNEAEAFGFGMDRAAYIQQHLDYKFKMLFPPAFWKAPQYTVNGMGFHEFTRITSGFVRRLEEAGILTGVPDEMMLMAQLSGVDPRQFRDLARLSCAAGQVDAIEKVVLACNRAQTGGNG